MKIKLISVIAVLIAGVATLVATLTGYANTANEYESYLAKARNNAEREIPYTACQNYKKALNMRCEDESIYLEYVEQAELLNEDYYYAALEGYITNFPQSANAYDLMCKYYYDSESYQAVITTALEAREKGIATEAVRDMYLECFHMLRIIETNLQEAQMFLGNVALVKRGDLYGYMNSEGVFQIAPMFQNASAMMSGNAAVNDGKEWYMMNSSGFKVARTSVPVDDLSFLSGGWIRVGVNGKYGFMTSALAVPENLPFDYAGNFKNGVAAVRKGDKWALVSSEGGNITDYIFDDILLDEYEACINGGVIFAKNNGKYYMYDAAGKQISQNGFDNAYPFVSSQPAAVCIGDKWGFADATGNIVIEPKYENARSFSIGLAPVQENGTWGYINTDGEYRVESYYEDCMPFASNGIAAVMEEGCWQYVKLLGYYN